MAAYEPQPLRKSDNGTDDEGGFSDVMLARTRNFDLRNFDMKDAYAYVDDMGQYARSASSRFTNRQRRFAAAGAAFLIVLLLVYGSTSSVSTSTAVVTASGLVAQQTGPWTKPNGLKIVAMVFYGRPLFVDILDCYLLRNLAVNGGYLDEIHFMAHTNKKQDLKWLDALIATNNRYSRVDIEGDYSGLWREHATEPETMYIKIDDDIVFVDDDAVPRLVHSLLAHPEAYAVASNLINSPVTHWLHYHTEAILPYLPEPTAPPAVRAEIQWRASKLPSYNGSISSVFNFSAPPPYANHRWLPLPRTSHNLLKTPIANASYDAWGTAWDSWAMAAQQHYSFFENLENLELDRYWAGNSAGIWNMQFYHYNINFMAIWGRTVIARPFYYDDEKAMSEMVPKELGMPLLVDTHAIVSHYAFGKQPELLSTDVLARYRAYANEKVCSSKNQKTKLVGLSADAGIHDYWAGSP